MLKNASSVMAKKDKDTRMMDEAITRKELEAKESDRNEPFHAKKTDQISELKIPNGKGDQPTCTSEIGSALSIIPPDST